MTTKSHNNHVTQQWQLSHTTRQLSHTTTKPYDKVTCWHETCTMYFKYKYITGNPYSGLWMVWSPWRFCLSVSTIKHGRSYAWHNNWIRSISFGLLVPFVKSKTVATIQQFIKYKQLHILSYNSNISVTLQKIQFYWDLLPGNVTVSNSSLFVWSNTQHIYASVMTGIYK